MLFILVTLNVSYKSIHLNQHLPLAAAALQPGSRGADGRRGRGVRAVARDDIMKGRKRTELEKSWRGGEGGTGPAVSPLCLRRSQPEWMPPSSVGLSQPGGGLNGELALRPVSSWWTHCGSQRFKKQMPCNSAPHTGWTEGGLPSALVLLATALSCPMPGAPFQWSTLSQPT